MTLGQKIKQAREEKGWNRQKLAEAIGVTYQSISNIENDSHRPLFNTIKQISIVLEVNLDNL